MNIEPELSRKFQAIWNRAANAHSDREITPALIQNWATDQGINDATAEDATAGRFVEIPVVILRTADARAIFPKVPFRRNPAWQARRQAMDVQAALWAKVEWFCPLWVGMGDASKLLGDIRRASGKQAIELFHYHTSTLYTLPFQAVCISQILSQAPSLKELVPLAREAYLAFYSGYRASSIAALIPALEGGLSRILPHTGADPLFVRIDRIFDKAIETASQWHFDLRGESQTWVPQTYQTCDYLFSQDEVVFALETYRRWLKTSFFANTDGYDGPSALNRNMFAHNTHMSWQQSSNFERMVVALATLGFVESWYDGTHTISPFFPAMNEDSELLWQQALLRGSMQGFIKRTEEKQFHKRGRLVPELPTDDGVLLRKAVLQQECMRDLVRPLRDAGWGIEVGEPDAAALSIVAKAHSADSRLTVALLYSCATDNGLYRKLAETCDAILYIGAPYHQAQYAYGINVHVGPVLGWQPPPAPGRAPRSSTLRTIWRRLKLALITIRTQRSAD